MGLRGVESKTGAGPAGCPEAEVRQNRLSLQRSRGLRDSAECKYLGGRESPVLLSTEHGGTGQETWTLRRELRKDKGTGFVLRQMGPNPDSDTSVTFPHCVSVLSPVKWQPREEVRSKFCTWSSVT